MGEPAGYLTRAPGRLANCRCGGGLDRVMKSFEALPSDRGLEGIRDDAPADQPFPGIGHPYEGVSPDFRRPLAMPVGFSGRLRGAAVITAAFQRPRHPRIERM